MNDMAKDRTVRTAEDVDQGIDPVELVVPLLANWMPLLSMPLAAGAFAVGATFLVAPTFTAKTTFMPPQQQQSAAASALASLGALAGLAGGPMPSRKQQRKR